MLRNLIVLPDGTEIFSGNPRGNAVASAEYRQKVNSGTELTIGSVCASCLSMKLIAGGGNLSIGAGTEFSYYKVSDNGERTKIGLFTMEKPTRSGANSYQIEAYDRVSWLDKDLTDWLSSLNGWPYSVENFAKMVCDACGLSLATTTLPNGDYQIRKFSGSGVTGRMLMQWLGQITCRFIRTNADGEIEFAWYADKGKEITTRGEFAYFGGGLSYEDFTVAEIQKVQIKASENDNGTVYPDGSEEELNTYKITGNYLLTAETGDELKPVARAIFEQLQGVTYTPCKVSIQATTEINAGDIVRITDRNGVTITAYVMSKTNKGQKDTLECTGSYKRDSSTATNTLTMKALNGKVLDIKKNVDGLRIENKDTAGKVTTLELTVDGLKTSVKDAEGNISKLEQSSKEITASVESVKKTSEKALKEAQKNATDLTNYAAQVSGSLTDLQNQIDGAIETWFDNYVPTATNAPASSWTTTEDKNKHLGDLFYIVDNEDKGGLVYRWALTNGVYGWVLVEDTEVAKALETASKAKDTADGKRRVFVAQPKPPYDVGDLWTNNTDLYVCQTARAEGSHTASDWKLATEYTTEKTVKALIKVAEDSVALQVQSVEKKVDGISCGGRNLLKNSSFSKNLKDWEPVGARFERVDGVGCCHITGANGTTKYISQDILAAIAEDSTEQTYVFTADVRLDSYIAGGTNPYVKLYLDGTYDKNGASAWLGGTTVSGTQELKQYSDHGWVRAEWVVRFKRPPTSMKAQIYARDFTGDLYFKNFKLERGNTATDWTPAPEDTEAEIAEVKEEVSTLKVTAKGVDMVSEDSNGKLVSFIGNRDTGGVWEAKYTKNGSVTSALYFDFAKGSFVFDGHVVARSGEIGGCFIVGGKLQVPAANIDGTLTIGQIPSNVATTDYVTSQGYQNASQVTTITNDTISTTNVTAQYLHVKAANIDGTLTAKQIDADNLVVQGANVKGSLSSNMIYVPSSYSYSSYANGGTWIDGSGLRVYSADGTGINYLDFGITYSNIASGNSTYILNIGNGTATAYGEWTFSGKIKSFTLGTQSSSYRIEAVRDKLSFYYSTTQCGLIETYTSYVNIVGTWRTNGSAWITSSDARLKNTIEDFTPAHDILFDHLRPRTYRWNEGTSDRTHSGFIVQEVVDAVGKAGLTTKDFAAVVNFKNDSGEDDGWGLRYEELISLNTWQIQKLKARIAELEGRLNYEVN